MVEELVEKLEARIGRMIEEVSQLREQKARLDSENDSLKITLADYEQTKSELESARERLSEVDSVSSELDDLRSAASERDELRGEVAAIRAEHDAVVAERDEMKGQIDELLAGADEEIATLRRERNDFETRLRSAIDREGQMKERLVRLIDRIETVEEHLNQMELVHENA